jgi:hypothetical protein
MKSGIMRLAILAGVMMLGAGCSTLGPAANSWIGAPVDEFVVLAGAPRREFKLQDGRVAYTWVINCEVTFVAKDGIFQSWSSTNCARIHPVPAKGRAMLPNE